MNRVSFKSMLAEIIPLALIGAGEDEGALLLVQRADVAVRAATEHQKLRQKLAYAANPEPTKRRSELRRIEKREDVNQARRARRSERAQHTLAKEREYAEARKDSGKASAYREATRADRREYSIKRAANVDEGYARELLAKTSLLPGRAFPRELVQLKQIEIKLKRLTK